MLVWKGGVGRRHEIVLWYEGMEWWYGTVVWQMLRDVGIGW